MDWDGGFLYVSVYTLTERALGSGSLNRKTNQFWGVDTLVSEAVGRW
jgi:hypothetical protein